MNLTSLTQEKESNFKGFIVWANQEAAAILVRLLLVFSATRMQKARAKLKGKDYAVFEDIPKELYELRKRQ